MTTTIVIKISYNSDDEHKVRELEFKLREAVSNSNLTAVVIREEKK
jgi:hypothetical protein